jgi:aerobic carbon-monoxide dehydrogenase large subunit
VIVTRQSTKPAAIGARLLRKEDDRFLHGRGQYIGDIRFTGMRDVAFVRSPVAHAPSDVGEVYRIEMLR